MGEGISPKRAQLVIEDPSTGERVSIVDLARSACNRSRVEDLSVVLDDAGVERERLHRAPQWMRQYGLA